MTLIAFDSTNLTDDYAWVNWLALLVALVSILWSSALQRQQNKQGKALLDIEQARHARELQLVGKAELQPFVQIRDIAYSSSRFPHNVPHLIIMNSGVAPARNLQIVVDSKPLEESVLGLTPDVDWSKTVLGPGSSTELRMTSRNPPGLKSPLLLVVTWEDDSGTLGKWEGHLTW